MKIKPRIRLTTLFCGLAKWECVNSENAKAWGYGDTPLAAYQQWRANYNRYVLGYTFEAAADSSKLS